MMASDDPLEQIEALIASDERQRSPVLPIATSLLKLFNSVPVLREMMGSITQPLAVVADLLQSWRQANVSLLLDTVADQVKRLNRDVASLSAEHRKFIGEEWVKLVIDGMAKAQQTRAKERIVRMGKALVHAFNEGDKQSPDLTEEILRVAMSLDDDDVRVLAWLCDGMKGKFIASSGRVDHESVNTFWGRIGTDGRSPSGGEPATPVGPSIGDTMSACAKLQSFGLVVQVHQNPSKVSPATLPFGPLKKGYDFLKYVRTPEASSAS
jgi:hypothetical protein